MLASSSVTATSPVATETEDRVQRLEFAIWGLRGDNGLVSEVKALRKEIEGTNKRLDEWREEERDRRESERKAVLDEQRRTFRWRLVFGVSVIVAIIGAAGLIAQSL